MVEITLGSVIFFTQATLRTIPQKLWRGRIRAMATRA
nr:MAG TPA: hypothetical protein [Caudoviricetes sp.]